MKFFLPVVEIVAEITSPQANFPSWLLTLIFLIMMVYFLGRRVTLMLWEGPLEFQRCSKESFMVLLLSHAAALYALLFLKKQRLEVDK
jgi:hypothetical protein